VSHLRLGAATRSPRASAEVTAHVAARAGRTENRKVPDTTAEAELDLRFLNEVRGLPYGGTAGAADRAAPVTAGTRLTGEQAIALFYAQAGSRHLDLAARYLRAEGRGFYTIGSAGH